MCRAYRCLQQCANDYKYQYNVGLKNSKDASRDISVANTYFLIISRAVAEYLSCDLPYLLSPDDVLLTSGCTQAIETVMSVLGQPGANILLPRPGYPKHEAHAVFHNMEVRHYNLVPEKGWEVDLEAVEALADENTVAIVITNPNNPCGSVYTYEHLSKVSKVSV